MDQPKNSTRNLFLTAMQRHSHIVGWLVVYLFMVLLSYRYLGWMAALRSTTATVLPMLLCWVMMQYVLLPHLLHRNKVAFFLASFVMLLVLVIFGSLQDYFIHHHFPGPFDNRPDGPSPEGEMFVLRSKYTILLLGTMAVVTINYLINQRKQQMDQFHEQQMQEQLKYLRAQINPHFLFNALNCIYALTMMRDEQAPTSVLKLSEMLRYVIDDCRADSVPLTKEVKYIQNYIDFQRIRMERKPKLTFDVQISDPHYTIPPMLLQPIIENCFKHSRLIDDPHAWVHISIRQNDSGLLFTCDNSKPSANAFSRQSAVLGRQDEERTGIGLMNVQQRLAVLFGDKCSLKVIEDKTHYKTVLHI